MPSAVAPGFQTHSVELQGSGERLRFPGTLIPVSTELQELPHPPGLLQVSHPPPHVLQPWGAPGFAMKAPGWIFPGLRKPQEWRVLDVPAGSWTP